MRRFDENATLDRLADRGKIDAALADALARAVVAAHADAPVVEAEPWIEALARFIAQNDAAFREMPDVFRRGRGRRVDDARAAPRSTACVRCCARAARLGFVRRGHGDLHLGNIALIDGRPVPFDAIEFDPLIAAGDVLYDLAFLLMDLVERGLAEAANIVLNRYLAETRRDERSRRARGAAAVHVAARRDPRQGHGGAARNRGCGRARRHHQGAAQPISASPAS